MGDKKMMLLFIWGCSQGLLGTILLLIDYPCSPKNLFLVMWAGVLFTALFWVCVKYVKESQ